MKKILLVLSLFTFSFSYSQDWKFAFENKVGKYYTKPDNNETVWIKIVSDEIKYYPTREIQNPKIIDGYEIILYKFNCKSNKIGFIQSTIYSKKDSLLYSFSSKKIKMKFGNPNSLAERLINAFCPK